MRVFGQVLIFGWMFLQGSHGFAYDYYLPSDQRLPIRSSYSQDKCITFYCPKELSPQGINKVSDSVGIPVANGGIEEFKTALSELLKLEGREKLEGAVFYVAGVDINDDSKLYNAHMKALEDFGLQDFVEVRVLSIEHRSMKTRTQRIINSILPRMSYLKPSKKRDYERPQSGEVVAGLISTAFIEMGSVYYLFTEKPLVDASLAVVSHTAILAAYIVLGKSILNWLRRPGTNYTEGFLKQLSLSFPFVLNYNLFANTTDIYNFVDQHRLFEILSQFQIEIVNFTAEQSLTMLLHTLFYYVVVVEVVGAWTNGKGGDQESEEARTFRQIIQAPVLFANAVLLAMASGVGAEVVTDFPVELNSGQVGLLALTAVGAITYKLTLNPSFKFYRWLRHKVAPAVESLGPTQWGIDFTMIKPLLTGQCHSLLTRTASVFK